MEKASVQCPEREAEDWAFMQEERQAVGCARDGQLGVRTAAHQLFE